MQNIEEIERNLLVQVVNSDSPRDIFKASELKQLYGAIKSIPEAERSEFGRRVNELKNSLELAVSKREADLESDSVETLDVTAPWDVNSCYYEMLPTENGSQHPLTRELENVADIFTRMGFEAIERHDERDHPQCQAEGNI